ncbi:hypothetical protein PSP3_gp92c [Pseudomonas phage PSP3-DeSoir-2023]|nr:hypothetical protein PSP3_gp92c [Pseudomonas phage PSP3-DeSoir-2023]
MSSDRPTRFPRRENHRPENSVQVSSRRWQVRTGGRNSDRSLGSSRQRALGEARSRSQGRVHPQTGA